MANPNDSRKTIFVPDKLALTIAISLLVLASTAWLASYYLMPLMMSGSSMMGVAGIVSSLSITSISFFEIVWIIGMIAMMFPAMIPIILFYNKVVTRQESNLSLARAIGTPLFLSGYLIVYAILGIVAYFGVYEAIKISTNFPQLAILSVAASSVVLVVAGMYQFTPLKSRCLSNCVSPLGFFALHYSKGSFGSIKMGLRHGIYCMGCCWAFMIVMLAVGAMSIPVMAALAGVIAFEKVLIRGAVWFNRLIGLSFISLGVAVLVFPSILALLS
jgi:predicted metal-binding membrane protein